MKRLRKFFAGLLALTTLVSTVPVNAYDANVPSVLNTGNNTTYDEFNIPVKIEYSYPNEYGDSTSYYINDKYTVKLKAVKDSNGTYTSFDTSEMTCSINLPQVVADVKEIDSSVVAVSNLELYGCYQLTADLSYENNVVTINGALDCDETSLLYNLNKYGSDTAFNNTRVGITFDVALAYTTDVTVHYLDVVTQEKIHDDIVLKAPKSTINSNGVVLELPVIDGYTFDFYEYSTDYVSLDYSNSSVTNKYDNDNITKDDIVDTGWDYTGVRLYADSHIMENKSSDINIYYLPNSEIEIYNVVNMDYTNAEFVGSYSIPYEEYRYIAYDRSSNQPSNLTGRTDVYKFNLNNTQFGVDKTEGGLNIPTLNANLVNTGTYGIFFNDNSLIYAGLQSDSYGDDSFNEDFITSVKGSINIEKVPTGLSSYSVLANRANYKDIFDYSTNYNFDDSHAFIGGKYYVHYMRPFKLSVVDEFYSADGSLDSSNERACIYVYPYTDIAPYLASGTLTINPLAEADRGVYTDLFSEPNLSPSYLELTEDTALIYKYNEPSPTPLVEVFEVYDYDYDNAKSLGIVSVDSTRAITASVTRNNTELTFASNQIKVPLNTASYVSYKGYNWSENRGSTTSAKVGKIITEDDALYICYETNPVTINVVDCYPTSLEYISSKMNTRISDSVAGGTTKKYYVLEQEGYEFQEVRKNTENTGNLVPVYEDSNGKYIEVLADSNTTYYFRYLQTANWEYNTFYYNVYDWDVDNAELVGDYHKYVTPDNQTIYKGVEPPTDKEGYIYETSVTTNPDSTSNWEVKRTEVYRFFSKDVDKVVNYDIVYKAVYNDVNNANNSYTTYTPAKGVIVNGVATGADGLISRKDTFVVTYESYRPVYSVNVDYDTDKPVVIKGTETIYYYENVKISDNLPENDVFEVSFTLERPDNNKEYSFEYKTARNTAIEGFSGSNNGNSYTFYELCYANYLNYPIVNGVLSAAEAIDTDSGDSHTRTIYINVGSEIKTIQRSIPVVINHKAGDNKLASYPYGSTVYTETTAFPTVDLVVEGDDAFATPIEVSTLNLPLTYDISNGIQEVENLYGVDESKIKLTGELHAYTYQGTNLDATGAVVDLESGIIGNDGTVLYGEETTYSVDFDAKTASILVELPDNSFYQGVNGQFVQYQLDIFYTVKDPIVTVHYKDTEGNTIREDNVYSEIRGYYPVEKIDGYIPTGVVEGSVVYPAVLEQEAQFAEYKGDNTGDKSHTLYLKYKGLSGATTFGDSEITIIYEEEPSYKVTVIDKFIDIDGNIVRTDERLVEYKKSGESYSYNALDPVPDGYILITDENYSGIITQDIVIEFVYKDDYARFVTVKGVVMYKDGTPVANKRIEIHSTPRYTVTDENGYYEVKNVEVGDHKFTIFANDVDDTPLVTCDLSVTKPDEDTVKVTFRSENTDVETDTSVTDVLEIDAYLPVYTIKVIDEYYTDGVLDKSEIRCEDNYKAGETYAYNALSPENYTVSGVTEASGVALSNLTITFKYVRNTVTPPVPEPKSFTLKVIDNFYDSNNRLIKSSVRVNNEVTEGTAYDYKALSVDNYKVSGTKRYTGKVTEDTTLVFTYIQEIKEPERYTLKVKDIFFDENGVVEKSSVRYEEVVDAGFSYYFKALDTKDYTVTSALEVNGVVNQDTEIIFTYVKSSIPVPESKEYKITVIDKFIVGKKVIEYNPYYLDNLGDDVTVTETDDGYELSVARFVTTDYETAVQSVVRCVDTYKEGAEYSYSALDLPEAWKVISDHHYAGIVTKDETLVFVYALGFEDDNDIPEDIPDPVPDKPFNEPVTGVETGKGLELVIFFGCLVMLLAILKKKEK